MVKGSDIFRFPNPVNEVSARVVAAGVAAMATTTVVSRQRWMLVPIAYGFVARALAGPTLSPLGQLATHRLQRVHNAASMDLRPIDLASRSDVVIAASNVRRLT